MRASLNYLAVQERTADLRRSADAERLGREAAPVRPGRGERSAARSAAGLWLRVTRARSAAPGEPDTNRVHA